MKMFYSKSRSGIVFMVVLAMLLQIIGPMAEAVYAQSEEIRLKDGNFEIELGPIEEGKATVNWKYVYQPREDEEDLKYELKLGSTLENYKEESEDLDLVSDKGKIGAYTISKDGTISITIYGKTVKEIVGLQEEIKVPEETVPVVPEPEEIVPVVPETVPEPEEIVPVVPETVPEPEQSGDNMITDDMAGDEGNEGESDGSEVTDGVQEGGESNSIDSSDGTQKPEETGRIGKPLVSLASIGDVEGLGLDDDGWTFEGNFVVEEAEVEEVEEKQWEATTFAEGNNLGASIFTVDKLWIGRINGVGGTEITENTPVDLDGNTTITMRYDWSVKGEDAKAGDTASIKIPDIFNSAGDFPKADITLTDGIKVGTWTISEGFLKFTFDEGIETVDQNDLEDTFVEFGFKLNMIEFEKDIKQKIEFGDSINKTFNLVAKHTGDEVKSISKVGVPNGTGTDGKKDAKTITWTIDVLNTGSTDLEDVILSESSIPDGLSLNTDSFKKTELTIGLNGTKNTKGNATTISSSSNGNGFEINLGTVKPYSGYRIEYTTDIRDFTKTEFTNIATINKGTEPLTASGTVKNLIRSAPLEKIGTVVNADEIKWTINVNKGGISIASPKIVDELPAGLSMKKVNGTDQIFVYKNNIPVTTGVNTSVSGQELTVTLPAITKDDIYKIEYTTVVDYTKVNDGKYQKENTFTNSAWLYDGSNKIGDTAVTKNVTTTRKHLLYKEGSDPVKYGDTLSWTIKVNQAYHKIDNAVLHDTIPVNLEFNPDDVVIKKKVKGTNDFVTLTDGNRPVVTGLDGSREVTVTLGNITDEYEITYTTKITDDGLTEGASFENNAYLKYGNPGTGIGSGTINHPVDKTLTPPDNEYTKTSTNIDYDNKTISWKIEIDPIKDPITELEIVDTFPNKGMIFLPNGVEINGVVENSFKIMRGEDDITNTTGIYTLSPNGVDPDKGYNKGFTISFTKGTNDAPILSKEKMTITYKTSFDPQLEVGGKRLEPYEGTGAIEYKNEAVLKMKTKSGKTPTKTLTEKVLDKSETDSPSWNSGKKEGRRVYLDNGVLKDGWVSGKDRLIEWKIYTNYLKQNLGDGVTVTDTIGYEGKIDLESVQIKEYSVASSGGGTTDGNIADIKYDKDLTNNDKTLNIAFSEKVDKRYVIIYRTTVPEKSQGTYINSANVNTKDGNYPYNASVSYDKSDSYITKSSSAGENDNKVYTDDEIDWNIVINESLSTNMEDVEIVDTIAQGMAFKDGSMKVYKVEGSNEVEVEEGESKDYILDIVGDQNQATGTKVIVKFNNPINHKYIIKYKTIVTATTGSVSNSAEVKGSHIKTEKISEKSYTAEKFGFTGGNLPNRGSIKIVKTDDKTPSKKLSGAKFEVYYLLNGVKQIVTNASGQDTHTTNASGEINLTSLVLGREYFIREVEPPNGYVMNATSEISRTLTSEADEKDIELSFTNVKLEDAKGSIKFTKKGEAEDLLPGAEFTLYKKSDNSVVGTATSDGNGIVKFTNIPMGEYIIKETTAPTGYVVSGDILSVEVEQNNQVTTPKKDGAEIEEVKNTFVRGSIEIKKVDEDGKPLPGANFKLYKQTEDGNLGDAFAVNGEDVIATSDANGLVKFENIPYGKYIIKEVLAPDGYKASTEEIKVEIDAEGKSSIQDKTVMNEKIIGDIEVKKLDEDGKTGLPGAVFILERDGKEKYRSDKTDEYGSFVFTNVEYGKYTLKEVTPPEGYNLTTQTEEVEIKEPGQDPIIKKFENTKIRGSVKVRKVGENGEGLEGAEFSIYKSTDTRFENPISTVASDVNGDVIFTNVEYGKYNIKETKAPEGYNLSDKVIKDVEITTQDDVVIPTDNEISNTKIRGSIEILKRNRNTHRPLANAKIGLYTENDVLIGEKITGDDGKVIFEELEYGRYYYRELKAPAGYVLDNTRYYFDIEENGEMLERDLDNRRIPEDPYYPPGGGGGQPPGPTDPEKPTTPVDPTKPTEPTDPTDPVEITEVPEPEEPEIPIVVTPPKGGTVEFDEDGNWKYTPNPGFTGKDSFVLKHPDGTEELIEIDVDAPLGGTDADENGEKAPILPKTGEINGVLISLAGLFLILVGIILRRRTA